MTRTPNSESDKPRSMVEADTANGEAPEPEEQGDHTAARPGFDHHADTHPTGSRQAEENVENDPPA